ncbi:Aconitate hydratase [Venturia inaequalis]|nr:Aconitate hydratase [Venturia inaequalis]
MSAINAISPSRTTLFLNTPARHLLSQGAINIAMWAEIIKTPLSNPLKPSQNVAMASHTSGNPRPLLYWPLNNSGGEASSPLGGYLTSAIQETITHLPIHHSHDIACASNQCPGLVDGTD